MTARNPTWSPQGWARLYAEDAADGRAFVFQRGEELALTTAQDWLARRGDGAPTSRWVDLGCGSGRFAWLLAERGLDVTGIDNDPRAIEFAAAHPVSGSRAVITPRFIAGAIPGVALPDAGADALSALAVVGCFDDPAPLLREAFRLLRPGGLFIFTATLRASPLLAINKLLRRLDPLLGVTPLAANRIRYTLQHIDDLRSGLAAAGFEDSTVRRYNVFLNVGKALLPGRRVALWLERKLPRALLAALARNALITCRRPA